MFDQQIIMLQQSSSSVHHSAHFAQIYPLAHEGDQRLISLRDYAASFQSNCRELKLSEEANNVIELANAHYRLKNLVVEMESKSQNVEQFRNLKKEIWF